jgi:hypothetical protein
MLSAYLANALERAHYEIIDDEEPFYGEVPGLEGVWASGPTLGPAAERSRRPWRIAFFSIADC